MYYNIAKRQLESEAKYRQLYNEKSEELEGAQVRLAEANKINYEFIARMSHELRTPINVILGASQLIDSYNKNDLNSNSIKINKQVNSMRHNCYRLLRLVNNLIDSTSLDFGFSQMHIKNNNIVSIIEDIIMPVMEYVKPKDIRILFLSDSNERILACDIDMMQRIMLNLLSNAVKFSEPGGLVQVNVVNSSDSVLISVKDNGLGIPQYLLKNVFDRFSQEDNLFTRKNEGIGIGLFLTKLLIEMQGGRIDVKSELGQGSEFTVEIPVTFIQNENISLINDEKILQKYNIFEKIEIEFSDIF